MRHRVRCNMGEEVNRH